MAVIVVKRDGREEKFYYRKLYRSIEKAVIDGGMSKEDALDIYNEVMSQLAGDEKVDSKKISDLVEKTMIEKILENPKWEEAAKRYALARIYNDVYGKGRWSSFNDVDLSFTFNAIKVLEARYLLKNPETQRYRETPSMLHKRVASFLARVEEKYGKSKEEIEEIENEFLRLLNTHRFKPNTPTLMNADTELGILSACFVVPVRDSITTPRGDGIYDALRAQAVIFQQGGGTGFDFSELRPRNDTVSSTAGVSSGPISFMRLFDLNTEVIKQGGKRRGANMGVMHVWHPDIFDFIHAKTGELKDANLQNFNISVGVYDYFMEAIEKGEKLPLINPRKTDLLGMKDSRYYAIVKARHSLKEDWVKDIIARELEEKGSVPYEDSLIITIEEALSIAEEKGAIVDWVDPAKIFELIYKSAWEGGDPGLLFIDEINRRHPTWYLGKINATNPCVSGDTRILTPEGWKTAEEIFLEAKKNGIARGVTVDEQILGEGGEPTAYKTELITITGDEAVYRTIHGDTLDLKVPAKVESWVWHVGRKPGLKVITEEGYEITVTYDHKFLTPEGWKTAEELGPGDKISVARLHPAFASYDGNASLDEDVAFALGWLVGDGSFNKHYVAWFFSEEDKAAEERVRRGIELLGGNPLSHTYLLSKTEHKVQYNKGTRVYKNILDIIGGFLEKSRDRKIPDVVWKLQPKALAAFLRGLFTADGYVDNDRAVRLTSASLELLKEVQILLTAFGIQSTIYERPYAGVFHYTTKDGEEKTYKSIGYYELVIKGYSRKLFKDLIGFESIKKMEKLKLDKVKRDSLWATVKEIISIGDVDFYDFTVPLHHNYIANGLINHNCGEEPLLEWENCNLGSINLEKYVYEDEKGVPHVNWKELAEDVRVAIRFLDNVIDANRHPLPQITEANLRTRKVGLGVMSWARMLIRLRIPYDSPDAVKLAWAVSEWIAYHAYLESMQLAREKGTFPAWNPELYRFVWRTKKHGKPEDLLKLAGVPVKGEGIAERLIEERGEVNWDWLEQQIKKYGLRNAALLSIAPTGTISILSGASSSIEPLFALAFMRFVSVGQFIEVDSLFLKDLAKYELDNPDLIMEIAQTGSIADNKYLPRTLRRVYRVAHDIDPEWHLLHQAAWQAWVDAGVSKTVNLRHDEPPETVRRVYLLAWKLGVKGITVYRDKSKSSQVIEFGVKKEKQAEEIREENPPETEATESEPKPALVIEATRTDAVKKEVKVEAVRPPEDSSHETRETAGRARVRLGKGKVSKIIEVVTASEDYAGGCLTCDA
jgi:ribonucleoside-diphosphate reductase alpha chain